MPVAQESTARGVLPPDRQGKFWRAFRRALEDVTADISKYGIWPRTRANMMFERLTVRLQEEFALDAGLVFCFKDETVKITIDGIVLARCKKADGRGFGSNIETQTVMNFCDADEDLFGFPGFQKIEILYSLNSIGTEIAGIVVQARDGDMRLWSYQLDEGMAGGATIFPLPLAPAPAPSADDLVRPRRPDEKKIKEEDDKSEQ